MKVRDVMTSRLTTVTEKDTIGLAQQLMLWGNFRHLPVVRKNTLVGILSERDVLVTRADNPDWRQQTIKRAMTPSPHVTAPQIDLADASQHMTTHKIDCLPVVEDGRLVGILTTTDVLQAVEAGEREYGEIELRAIMTPDPEVADAEEALFEAVSRMLENGVRHLPVVDDDQRVIGILSDRDVRTAVGDPADALHGGSFEIEHVLVREVMTPNPATLTPDAPIGEAVAWFAGDRVGVLPIVDEDERLLGVVSYLDVLWYLRKHGAKVAATG